MDIDSSDEDNNTKSQQKLNPEQIEHEQLRNQMSASDMVTSKCQTEKISRVISDAKHIDLSKLDEETFRQITSLEVPKCEMVLASNYVSHLEKIINWDYFEGKIKTQQRYLKVKFIKTRSYAQRTGKHLKLCKKWKTFL